MISTASGRLLAADTTTDGRALDLMTADSTWMALAACGEHPPNVFFPVDGVGVEIARKICARPARYRNRAWNTRSSIASSTGCGEGPPSEAGGAFTGPDNLPLRRSAAAGNGGVCTAAALSVTSPWVYDSKVGSPKSNPSLRGGRGEGRTSLRLSESA